jgi:hypothetical protein
MTPNFSTSMFVVFPRVTTITTFFRARGSTNSTTQFTPRPNIMWEKNAPVGGTPSIGPFQFNSGGGLGPTVSGTSLTYALLNYTMFKCSDKDFFTVRNEWVKDENGTRYGYAGNYSSHTIGLTHNFNSVFQVRPEIGYYRNWNNPAFNNGNHKGMTLYGLDMTLRF